MTVEKCSQPNKIPTWMDIWPQVLAVLISSCANCQVGILLAHSGVLIPQLAADENIVGFDRDAASWIAGLYSISSIIGNLGGPVMDKIGRKKALIASQIPIVINWVIMSTTYYSIWPIYIARTIGPIGGGLLDVVLFVYTAEIAHSHYRAPLVILNSLTCALGILLATTIGVALEWRVSCIVFGVFAFINGLALFFIPESPYWMAYFKKSPPEKIQEELRKLNRPEWLFQEAWTEIQTMNQKGTEESETMKSSIFKDFTTILTERTTYIPLILIAFIIIFQQAAGVYLFISYSANVIASLGKTTISGYEISIEGAVMFMGAARVITTVASAILSQVSSKNTIMITTGLVTALSAASVSVFMALNGVENIDFESAITELPASTNELNSLLAIVSLFIFVGAGSMGMLIFPWTLASDLFSTAVRAFGNTFTFFFGNLMLFLAVKTFPYWLDVISLPVIFGIFACSAFFFVIFVWIFIPNTYNKSFEELANIFAKK